MKYKTKPYTIEAIQWTGNNEKEVEEFIGAGNVKFTYKILDGYTVREVEERPKNEDDLCCAYASIRTTLEGYKTAKQGDFISKNLAGEINVHKQIMFERDFEKMRDGE